MDYFNLIGSWENYRSEVPDFVGGSEVYHFKEGNILLVEVKDGNKLDKMRFNVKMSPEGLDLLRRDGSVFLHWKLELQGQILRLSHNQHPFKSWLRRVES